MEYSLGAGGLVDAVQRNQRRTSPDVPSFKAKRGL
jgi:hypothetical protein